MDLSSIPLVEASWVYVAVAAVTVTASVVKGRGEARAKAAEAKQFEENAKLARLSADQLAEERQQDLLSTLSSIRALRTSRGMDANSPTSAVIRDKLENEAAVGMSADRINALKEAKGMYGAASVASARGRTSLLSGYLDAGASALSAYGKTQSK